MNLEYLKEKLNQRMAYHTQHENLNTVMTPGFADRRIYAIYLTETFHYTRHNARNQALVATRDEPMDPRYMKFCLKHAEEEVGHELMALHDLKNMGYEVTENKLPEPLPATQELIRYLYEVAGKRNPLARLGYSYWAERSYDYIMPIINMISEKFKISSQSMTFFNAHSSIDVGHAKEVDEIISRFVKNESDWKEIELVMIESLDLTANMMNAVFHEFSQMKESKDSRYRFLT